MADTGLRKEHRRVLASPGDLEEVIGLSERLLRVREYGMAHELARSAIDYRRKPTEQNIRARRKLMSFLFRTGKKHNGRVGRVIVQSALTTDYSGMGICYDMVEDFMEIAAMQADETLVFQGRSRELSEKVNFLTWGTPQPKGVLHFSYTHTHARFELLYLRSWEIAKSARCSFEHCRHSSIDCGDVWVLAHWNASGDALSIKLHSYFIHQDLAENANIFAHANRLQEDGRAAMVLDLYEVLDSLGVPRSSLE